MKRHVSDLLYDYAAGELAEAERARVEEHCGACSACAADLEEIREALVYLRRPADPPSEARDPAFWTAFANAVDARLSGGARARASLASTVRDHISSFLTLNRAPLLAGAGTLAMIAAATVLFWPRATDVRPPETIADTSAPALAVQPAAQRMNDYLKKSKVLLVGIANMRTDEGHPLDLRVERRQSRELVHEARYLRQQPMEARSARLIGDLEKILIELANIEEDQDIPNVEMIRSGIRRENLLFKIRMTESYIQAGIQERGNQ